ncbi:hypothetical protein PYW08_016064 [Mythimna loreyi]|uniref:Uncharacterized protein n=1 Tax=Mythimna loreyi TaxID=667449 RepID=A0ACC2QT00_9NEOP|nr:hypothetical protein PYW08_016064 [Mythimna loreyi]
MADEQKPRELFPVKFNGDLYDLNKFMKDHPGGVNTLKNYKGKSVLHAMQKFGHSSSAYHMMNDLKVDCDELKDVNLTGEVSANGRIITSEEQTRNVEEIKFLEELEARLDWSKPLLCQLEAIAPHYDTWVNSAVYRKCRLFASPLLESLTYTPWYLVPMFWVPIILYLGFSQYMELVACGDSCRQTPLTNFQYICHLGLGVLLWTALEYSLHRWVFHLDPGSSVTMIQVHFLIHGMHHKVPFDGLRQVFPPVPAFFLGVLLFVMLQPFLDLPYLKLTGAIIGYLTYDMIHYYVHHGAPRDGTYLYTMKRYHSNHHFINHDKAFGISSSIWDHVFRTFVRVKKLGFSLHW